MLQHRLQGRMVKLVSHHRFSQVLEEYETQAPGQDLLVMPHGSQKPVRRYARRWGNWQTRSTDEISGTLTICLADPSQTNRKLRRHHHTGRHSFSM